MHYLLSWTNRTQPNSSSGSKVQILTSKMIHHRGGGGVEPERACIVDLIFCHGIQTMANSRICHCCCFMSMVSKNFVQPFLRSRKLLYVAMLNVQNFFQEALAVIFAKA